jgi:hypothetical protein
VPPNNARWPEYWMTPFCVMTAVASSSVELRQVASSSASLSGLGTLGGAS